MTTQLGEQQGMVDLLQGTLDTFSAKIFGEKIDRDLFLEKMKSFIQAGSASFSIIAERSCNAEKELSKAQHALKESNDRYETLIEKHTLLLERFEKLLPARLLEESLTSTSGTNISGMMFFSTESVKQPLINTPVTPSTDGNFSAL
jgi:hypothetical protein